MRQNLYQLALRNEKGLHDKFQRLLDDHLGLPHADKLQCLHDECEAEWSISINLTSEGLEFFLASGKPYNRYRYDHEHGIPVFKENPAPNYSPVDWDTYQLTLGPYWGPKRRAFNEFAENEENFTYGAYFLQGEGVKSFGSYMLKLKVANFLKTSELSFLMADSLQFYTTDPTGDSPISILLVSKLKEEIATLGTVTKLMCCKKENVLQSTTVADCKMRVCWSETEERDSKTEYLEANITREIGFEDIEAFYAKRLNQDEADHVMRFLGEDNPLNPENLQTQEEENAYYYQRFRTEFLQKGIPVLNFA